MPKPAAKPKQLSRPAAKPSLLQRVAGFFRKSAKASLAPKKSPSHEGLVALTKAESALLPPFPGLPLSRIYVPHTEAECKAAAEAIFAAGVAGFDTEAKPTFRAGEKSTGPHVVQFALTDCCYIFQLHRNECLPFVASLIESELLLKVGFGLRNDHGQIRNRFGVTIHNVLDLDQVFKKRGHKNQIGVRGAMAELLQLSFPKSKTTTTSNWAAATLTPRQLTYAANDAYAALKIMEALDLKPSDFPKPNAPAEPRERAPRRRRRKPAAAREGAATPAAPRQPRS